MDGFESQLPMMLEQIAQTECKIDSYRELLNQQIQFNLKDLYTEVCGNSALANAYHFQDFISTFEEQYDLTILESMVKFYNNCTSMNLSFIQFSLMFLMRENRLLAKVVVERNSLGSIPVYLLNYAKKIVGLQYQLHSKLIQFRAKFSSEAEKWIENLAIINENNSFINEVLLEGMCEELQIPHEHLIRYIKIVHHGKIDPRQMYSLFTLKNSTTVKKFLSKKTPAPSLNSKIQPDPFIRPQFHDCLDRPQPIDLFSRREIKSIEKHLDRINTKKQNLNQKIQKYRNFIQKQIITVCGAMKEIIWLEKEIQYERIELCLCNDFYPVLFFESIDKDRQNMIIPSSLKDYLEVFGIKVELSSLFPFFKRFSHNEGKLDFNDFCSIFDVCKTAYSKIDKNRKIKCLNDIELETKKLFFKLIKLIIKNEVTIQKIKHKYMSNELLNLRNVFSCLDTDKDGLLSMLDLRVAWKKYLLLDMTEEQVELFWFRIGLKPNQMMKYEKFIYEMIPKTNMKTKK